MQKLHLGKTLLALAVMVLFIWTIRHFSERAADQGAPSPRLASKPQNHRSSERIFKTHDRPLDEMEVFGQPPADEAGSSRLPREKVDEYLTRNNRNPASLLAAFHALHDTNYLQEAAVNFPNDPQVQWTVLAQNS